MNWWNKLDSDTVSARWSFMPLTATLIIISLSSPTLTFIPDLKPSFSANPSQPFFFFFRTDYMIPQTSTVTSSIGCFYFLVFLFYNFQLSFPCGRLSRLMSAFERTLKSRLVSYRIVSYRKRFQEQTTTIVVTR